MSVLRNGAATRWDLDLIFGKLRLGPPFGEGVTFADVDFEIERKGRFLVLEGKREGQYLSTGQSRAMQARLWTGRTCLVFWGDPDAGNVTEVGIYVPKFRGARSYDLARRPADCAALWTVCHVWWTWADAQPWPAQTPSGFDALGALEAVPSGEPDERERAAILAAEFSETFA